jgi:hypothetical protein
MMNTKQVIDGMSWYQFDNEDNIWDTTPEKPYLGNIIILKSSWQSSMHERDGERSIGRC